MNTDTEVTAWFSKPLQCTYSISPKTYTFNVKGGAFGIAVTASGSSCLEPSLSNSTEDWVQATITSWKNNKGIATVTVDPSYSSVKKVSSIGIGNATFTVIQKPRSCTPGGVPPTLTPSKALWPQAGGTGSFDIIFAPNAAVDCIWTAKPTKHTSRWVTTDATGMGNSTVQYTVDPNLSNDIREGNIKVRLVQDPLDVYKFHLKQLD
jgi:hypothetical protein